MSLTRTAAARDLVLLISRIGLGVVFIAHGWQKFRTNGLDGTAAMFDQMGVPAPTLSAYYATGIELLGGIALILGVLTPVVGVLGLLSLTLAVVGAGRVSLDSIFSRSTSRAKVAA